MAFQTMGELPNLKGVFVFGTVPVGNAPGLPPAFLTPEESYAGAAVGYGVVANLSAPQVTDYVTAFFKPNYAPIPQFFFDMGLRTDPGTRAAVLNVVIGADPDFSDEVQLVKNMSIPLAIVHAEQDAFTRYEYLTGLAPELPTLWRNQIVTVPNVGHAIHWEQPKRFIKLLKRFIADL
ncbi:alpha/beta fold hydrolase [Bdellovibrio bacteriovorus]|uniref:alpha/beta fold hydrolase n=1 Tax=Bdellovibrio bacteriovorus TaxID=959 RepID=UPI0035A63AED